MPLFECSWRLMNRGWHVRVWAMNWCEGHRDVFVVALWRGADMPWRSWHLLWDEDAGLELRITKEGKRSGWALQGPLRRTC